MMTGVPNAPINGLRNFDLTHPGQKDPSYLLPLMKDTMLQWLEAM